MSSVFPVGGAWMLSSIVDAMQYGHGALAGAALSTNTNPVLPWQFGCAKVDQLDIRRSVVALQAMGGRVLSSVCLVGGARVLSQVYTSMAAQLYGWLELHGSTVVDFVDSNGGKCGAGQFVKLFVAGPPPPYG